jgi:divalent metal cation (Fe/Co/Zn/Cd) transporter
VTGETDLRPGAETEVGREPEAAPPARRPLRLAIALVALTLAYNAIEAVIAIWAGTEAGSIALFGFGLDSVIELTAATVLLWRLLVELRGGDPERVEATERRAHLFVGITFLALAAYVMVQAILTLVRTDRPEESLVGIVLAAVSLAVMPLLAWGKLRTASRMGSEALRAEAKETLACAYLSLTLLVGLALNSALGWWWADPVAALVMVPWLVREGVEGVRGEEDGAGDGEGGVEEGGA